MIRRKKAADIPEIAKVHYLSYIDTYKGLVPDAHLETQHEADYIEKHQQFNADCWVAEQDHRIVGVVMYGPTQDDDLQGAYEIYMIYLLPEVQRQGIGSALLQKAEAEIAKKAQQVALWVVDSNFDTIHFYEQHGYQFDGEEVEDEGFREQRMVKGFEKSH